MDTAAPQGLLARLSEVEQRELLNMGTVRPYAPGEFVCRQGEAGRFAALILRGTVKVQMSADDGSTTLLGLCGPGDLVGELSALRGEGAPREATVRAVDRVACRQIGHAQFRRLLGDRPGIHHAITLLQIDRMRQTAAAKLHSAAHPITVRTAQAVSDLADRHGRPCSDGIAIHLAITQQDLAELVGGCRESVVRALADLRERQLVRTGRQRIVVRDPAALRRIAGAVRTSDSIAYHSPGTRRRVAL